MIVDTAAPFDRIRLGDDLKGVPLAVMAPAFGRFRRLAEKIKGLRDLNLRVYLPCDTPENIVGLRILSSLGIHGCAVFTNQPPDWEALTDLMTYAVLERTPHAAIEPFAAMTARYDPFSRLSWSAFFFDDPEQFLHLDAKGRVALSHEELEKNKFVAGHLSEISAADEFPAIRERVEAWRRFFTECHPCAACQAWKICQGRFSAAGAADKGCASFFLELMDVARQIKAQHTLLEACRVWQP